MDYLRTIALILLSALSVRAQPLQQAELGWSQGASALGGLETYVIPKNTKLTNVLTGYAAHGVTFSITTPPVNGSISSFGQRTGTNVYTPDLDYVGSDTFTYSVAANGQSAASALGYVLISVVDTNATCLTNCGEYCCLPIYFSGQGPCNAPGVIISRSLIDPSKDYALTIADKNGQVSGTFTHNAGDPDDDWTPPPYAEDSIDLRFCGTLHSQPFFPVGNPICITLCGSAAAGNTNDCSNPTNELWAYAANGGTYTVVTNQNYFNLTGHNPSSYVSNVVCGAIPPFTTVDTSICNNTATNRTLVMYGVWNLFAQGAIPCGGGLQGIGANLNMNGLHFHTFDSTSGSPVADVLDCDTGIFCGSGNAYAVSNAITVPPNSTTNLTFNFRFYSAGANAPQATTLNVTNFWLQ